MKKLFVIAAMLLCVCGNASAQEVVRSGNTFSAARHATHSKDTLVTKFTWDDGDVKYPIIINRSSGRCYIFKKSSKTGRLYKYYMKIEVSKQICKELGIEFVESKKTESKLITQ